MPNRILREGILTSDRVDVLSFGEEVFYRRLHSVVDDFGRYTADERLLLAALYPLRVSEVTVADVAAWLAATVRAGLVRAYSVEGKSFLEIQDFRQRTRASASKYPAPAGPSPAPCLTDDRQVTVTRPSHAHGDGDGDGDGDVRGILTDSPLLELTLEPERQAKDGFPAFWGTYPRKVGKGAALKSWARLKAEDRAEALSALPVWAEAWAPVPVDFRSTCPHPATWINGRRWEDPAEEVRSSAARALRDSRPVRPLVPTVGKSTLPPAPEPTKRPSNVEGVPSEVAAASQKRADFLAWERGGCTGPRPASFHPARFYGPDSRDDEATRLHFWEIGDDEAFTRNRERRTA